MHILKEAIETVREAASFYAEAAQTMSDPNGKAVLENLYQD